MATIKEVAKHAGVSVGTVSNVINGKKVNEALRLAVEQAIGELGYTPHGVARSLKNSRTNNIALVLPNLMDPYLSEFIKNSERFLRESGFNLSLYITNSMADDENRVLENVMQHLFDGVVLYSCQKEASSKITELAESGLPAVYLEKECLTGEDVNFVAFDNRTAVQEAVSYLMGLGHRRIALISGEESFSDLSLIQGYREALCGCSIPSDDALVRRVEATKESAFKEMFALLQMPLPPTAVILSSKAMADGIFEAAFFNGISIPEDLSMITLAETTWLNHGKMLHTTIERPVEEISRAVCDLLIQNIRKPKMFEVGKRYIKTEFVIRSTCALVPSRAFQKKHRQPGADLNALLLESPAAHAIKLLLPHFRQKFGLNMEIQMLTFEELYEQTEQELVKTSNSFDVFMVDVSRFYAMCETGSITDITDAIEDDGGFPQGCFINGLFESYCIHKGRVFGLPFMPGTQILFYRKDLFTDRDLRSAYNRMFDSLLRPPRNWPEFNKIARFFTTTLNNSPIPYGITMAAKLPVFVTNEFCPRKWAYGARAFDENGNVAIQSSEALNALKNFIQSYSYAPPWVIENDWDGEINDFCSGQCAMMIQYESHSTRISSQMRKDLKGCVGYEVVPGGKPLLGGWSLVVNKHSEKPSEALNFVKWACSHELAVPYSILGGTTAWKSYYKSADLSILYPWLDVAYRSYKLARKRSSPYRGGPTILKQGEYEEILGEEIKKVLAGEISAEACLKNAEERLKSLID